MQKSLSHTLLSYKLQQSRYDSDREPTQQMLRDTPKRLLYKNRGGSNIVRPNKTEYSDSYSVHESQVQKADTDAVEGDILETINEGSESQVMEEIQNSIIDLEKQFPEFTITKESDGTILVNHSKNFNNTAYRSQFTAYQTMNSSQLNQNDEPAWRNLYSSKVGSLKVESTFQNDFKPFVTSPTLSAKPQHVSSPSKFIATTCYNVQINIISRINTSTGVNRNKNLFYHQIFLHHYQDQHSVIKPVMELSTKQQAARKLKYSVQGLILVWDPYHFWVGKNLQQSLFLPCLVKWLHSKRIKYLNENNQKSAEAVKSFKNQYTSEFKREFTKFGEGPKSLAQVKNFLQKTLIKFN